MRITVNNNDYLLQWGMGAILQYCDDMGCDLDGLSLVEQPGKEGQKALFCLIMAAIKFGCKYENKVCEINEAQLMVAINDMDQESFQDILNDFIDSKYNGKTIREHLYGNVQVEPEGGKKKTKPSKRQK